MTLAEVLSELESLGTAQNRKVYPRHGITAPLFGVSYANLGAMRKRIKRDHGLALELWESGIHDARVLATMIVDPERVDEALLDAWAADLDNYVITEALVNVAARSAPATAKMREWIDADGEWLETAGWGIMGSLALELADDPDEDALAGYVRRIEQELPSAKNRVRHAMNGALIAIGARSDGLEPAAIAAANRIGRVEVDHGETGCKTPAAAGYIPKARDRQRRREAKLSSSPR